ncbi:MAG: NAD(P)-dependent oxidoreductase [Gammaproteobacteria bacterium]|nr:NAD(P)-dependent oxidoreductase [Gammaproteobacteria bacterium]MDE2345769.1 NAD(P)-dependent oxidoreductase [Gammaproteobacteria bacterium]
MHRSLKGKTLFITGASRGIGAAIALRAAADGANTVIAAKSARRHPKLPGTIHSVASQAADAGGTALAVEMDLRDEQSVRAAIRQCMNRFGGIDILVNNAGAIWLAGTLETPIKRFDLMMAVNVRGTFLCSQSALPYLLKSANPHILNLAPPPDLDPRWFRNHGAYTISKYGMSLCTLGMAAEFSGRVAVNALWPRTVIATAAVNMLGGKIQAENCRTPAIVADAACSILTRDHKTCSGRFFLDEDVLREEGMQDFTGYAVKAGADLELDLFVDQ